MRSEEEIKGVASKLVREIVDTTEEEDFDAGEFEHKRFALEILLWILEDLDKEPEEILVLFEEEPKKEVR